MKSSIYSIYYIKNKKLRKHNPINFNCPNAWLFIRAKNTSGRLDVYARDPGQIQWFGFIAKGIALKVRQKVGEEQIYIDHVIHTGVHLKLITLY